METPTQAPDAGPVEPPLATSQPAVLLVDDEPNVINALRRSLRSEPYTLLFTSDPAQAIELARQHRPPVVVCDMRMPGLSGVEVLKAVKEVVPESSRILLTGYADMQSTIAAINEGRVHKYLTKPWNDEELKQVLHEQMALALLRRERDHLAAQLQHKVSELELLNHELDRRVEARTQEVYQTNLFLEQAHRDLKEQYLSAVKVFANLVELRSPAMAGHSRRVAELARHTAVLLQCSDLEIQDVYVAALLHDIGKIGLPDSALNTPLPELDGHARSALHRHAVKGQAALVGLHDLHNAALYIRHHHERFDGQGYPDGLHGLNIPRGARILAVAEDFDELQLGWLTAQPLSAKDALAFLMGSAGKRYDPDVLAVLPKAIELLLATPKDGELMEPVDHLVPGMRLTRDVISPDGLLLMSKGSAISTTLIQHLREIRSHEGVDVKVYVQAPKGAAPGLTT